MRRLACFLEKQCSSVLSRRDRTPTDVCPRREAWEGDDLAGNCHHDGRSSAWKGFMNGMGGLKIGYEEEVYRPRMTILRVQVLARNEWCHPKRLFEEAVQGRRAVVHASPPPGPSDKILKLPILQLREPPDKICNRQTYAI